jgi:DNA-binding transcriptional ArsR family regulator
MSKIDVGLAPASVFAALGDRTRLSLVMQLSDGRSRSIATLSASTRLTRQAVTKHLRALEKAGVVRSVRVGRESRFAYQPQAVEQASAFLAAIAAQWDEALGRLRGFIEDSQE